jgi:hypothetical protein
MKYFFVRQEKGRVLLRHVFGPKILRSETYIWDQHRILSETAIKSRSKS